MLELTVVMNNQEPIILKIIVDGEAHLVRTFRNEYRSLMVLIQDKLYPDNFGECRGMGRCATCIVQLNDRQETVDMDRNESSTLSKQGISDPSIRLSCQLLINSALHGATVTVLS